jgi:hypothetical protein
MTLTLNLSTRRWELQMALVYQLEYWPLLVRWSNAAESGVIFKFLFFVFRFGMDRK